jgi:phospholipid-binding lipoprotein MlaA
LLFDPLQSVGTMAQIDYATGAKIADRAISRGAFMDTIDSILYKSADSYAVARLAYLQNRRFELGEASPTGDEIDPFSDELSLEGFE